MAAEDTNCAAEEPACRATIARGRRGAEERVHESGDPARWNATGERTMHGRTREVRPTLLILLVHILISVMISRKQREKALESQLAKLAGPNWQVRSQPFRIYLTLSSNTLSG